MNVGKLLVHFFAPDVGGSFGLGDAAGCIITQWRVLHTHPCPCCTRTKAVACCFQVHLLDHQRWLSRKYTSLLLRSVVPEFFRSTTGNLPSYLTVLKKRVGLDDTFLRASLWLKGSGRW